MSQGKLQKIVAEYRQQLLAREAQATQTLEQAYAHVLATIQPQLNKLYKEIAEKQANGETVPLSWLYEAKRLQTLKQLIQKQINHYAALAQMQAGQLQHIGATLGQQSAQAMLQASVPSEVKWSFGVPSHDAIVNIVGSTQSGSPLADLFAGFGDEAASKAGQALITGVSLGWNPRQIAPMIEQALGISRNRALVVSRTECIRAYKSMQFANYQANSDVLDGWVWICALEHSCAACIAMHGTKHPLSEELQDHPCGRCAAVPLTKSWSDIFDGLGLDSSGISDTSIDIQSGSEWFDNQDESMQREILGSKYDGWANGNFTLSDVVQRHNDPDWGRSISEKPLKALVN